MQPTNQQGVQNDQTNSAIPPAAVRTAPLRKSDFRSVGESCLPSYHLVEMKNLTFLLSLLVWTGCSVMEKNRPTIKQEVTAPVLHHPKKGACLTTVRQNQDTWQAKVAALRVSWHYSWGATLAAEEPKGVEFVPMIWGYWGTNESFLATIQELTAAKSDNSRKHLLGFNEPDGTGKDQSKMTVAKALEAWPHLMQTGLRLGSPGAVHADKEWMQEFMKEAAAKGYRVDFVCVHWYGGPNVPAFLDRLRKIHQLYGKPIWITEFAVADWKAESREKNKHSPEVVLKFMQEVLPALDELDFVERYAWFSFPTNHRALGPSALFTDDGTLTELGQFYAAHQSAKQPRQ